MANDRHFDGIANKFAKNIYGTTKGKLRHTLLCDALIPVLSGEPLSVIEIGGGTGVMSEHIHTMGHRVMLTDASEDVLAHARDTLDPSIVIRQQTLQSIDDLNDYDVVVCHAVLEWLERPYDAITSMFEQMKSGATLSLSFFNKDAAIFSNAVYGNFDYIAQGLKVKKQVKLNPNQPLPAKPVLAHCKSIGFEVKQVTGIRCFHDYMRDLEKQTLLYDELLSTERKYNTTEPFVWLGRYMHFLLEKPVK